MCCEAITAPIYAPLADRLGRRPVFLGCLFFWGIFAVCFGFVQSVGMAIVMRGCCESPLLSRYKILMCPQWAFLQVVAFYHGQ